MAKQETTKEDAAKAEAVATEAAEEAKIEIEAKLLDAVKDQISSNHKKAVAEAKGAKAKAPKAPDTKDLAIMEYKHRGTAYNVILTDYRKFTVSI